jgi:uncharacterized protein involved in propanediol utilization
MTVTTLTMRLPAVASSLPLDESTAPSVDRLTIGVGHSAGHHGELFQGMYVGRHAATRALVTLPCARLWSHARFAPARAVPVAVTPAWKAKAATAARLTLDHLGFTGWGGQLDLESNIEVGWGLGSSTSDVVAAIRAVAAATGTTLRSAAIAQLAVAAEVASDSIMFEDRAVIFAHRAGDVLEDLGGDIPPLLVVGFNSCANGVDTLAMPPADYSWSEVEAFRPLTGLLRRAVRRQDPQLLGLVATASARINERFLPKPGFESLVELVTAHGAVGVQVAHSGTVVGVLFDGASRAAEAQAERCRAALAGVGVTRSWTFTTGTP